MIDQGSWKHAEVGLAGAVVAIIALLVVPLPPVVLDLLLVLSIAASLVVLLVALETRRALDFSVFPAMLLLFTLYRLALNVSSTRLILGRGEAGKVIDAFGNFVIGGNYAVGVVIFLILIAINFVVITKGAGRVAEVAARFTLDAMPGRQMSIDGDLSAGLIDDVEAKRRREEISREADFYGAMDGAAKFVRGDAIAGLLITAINIVGGLFIGVAQRGMPVGRALTEYTLLTVGDGLVSQVPALIVSTAAGIMVTRSAGGLQMGDEVADQLSTHPNAIWMAAGVLAVMGLIPGLPTLPFFALAGGTAAVARLAQERRSDKEKAAQVGQEKKPAKTEPENPVRELLQLDRVELEVGYALISLVDPKSGGDLLDRISLLRKQAAQEIGFLIPPVRIRDNVSLPPDGYAVRIRGAEVARGEVMPRQLLALDTGNASPIEGVETIDPSFGLPARWIAPSARQTAELRGYTVVEPSTVVATHLMEILKRHASDLLTRQDVQEMVDTLKELYPALVENVVPERVPLGTLHRVLQRLLRERVPIRDLVTILETLADAAEVSKDPEILTERVRYALAKVIGDQYADEKGRVRGITVGPRLEASLMRLFSPRDGNAGALLDPDTLTRLLSQLDRLARTPGGDHPLIAPPGLRVGIRRLIEPVLPQVPVVSLSELPPQLTVNSIATWELPDAA
ncbi:MAG: flagellar biosynthesis protein FlhA [Gemmatimonadetes bacterium]|nr:flagellar biosynthesis protein FlhA [Gemmatimonadota bacterium]